MAHVLRPPFDFGRVATEKRKGRKLADAIQADEVAARRLEEMESQEEQNKFFAEYAEAMGLHTYEDPVSILAMNLCSYTLEVKYNVNTGICSWMDMGLQEMYRKNMEEVYAEDPD